MLKSSKPKALPDVELQSSQQVLIVISSFEFLPKPCLLLASIFSPKNFQASLKFVELGERFTLSPTGTKEYTDLQTRISKSMNEATQLPKVPGFQDVVITKLKRFAQIIVNKNRLTKHI